MGPTVSRGQIWSRPITHSADGLELGAYRWGLTALGPTVSRHQIWSRRNTHWPFASYSLGDYRFKAPDLEPVKHSFDWGLQLGAYSLGAYSLKAPALEPVKQ